LQKQASDWLVWHSVTATVTSVKLHRDQVSTGIGDHLWRVCHSGIFQVTQPGHPSRVDAMSNGDGFGHRQGRDKN